MADTLNIRVQVFAGSKVEATCEDLVALARRLGIHAMADFNGVTLCADPHHGNADSLHESWKREIAKPAGAHKFAHSLNGKRQ